MGGSFEGQYHPRNIKHLRLYGVKELIWLDQPSEWVLIIVPDVPLRALPGGIKVRAHAVDKYAEFIKPREKK